MSAVLAAVPVDTGPFTWGYVAGAVLTGFVIIAPLLLIAYINSDAHHRRMARVRRYLNRRHP